VAAYEQKSCQFFIAIRKNPADPKISSFSAHYT